MSSIAPTLAAIQRIVGSELTILLIGRTGSGKSSTGNELYRAANPGCADYFAVNEFESCTAAPKMATTSLHGLKINIIDSPGLLDDKGMEADAKQVRAMLEYLDKLQSGVDAVIYVDRFDNTRFDASEKGIVNTFSKVYSSEGVHLWQYVLGVLTRGANPVRDRADFLQKRIDKVQAGIMDAAPTNVRVPIAVVDNVNLVLPDGSHSIQNVFEGILKIVQVNGANKLKIQLPKDIQEKLEHVKQNKNKMSDAQLAMALAPIVISVVKFLFGAGGCTIL